MGGILSSFTALSPASTTAAVETSKVDPKNDGSSLEERICSAFASVQEQVVQLKHLVDTRRPRSLTADQISEAESTTASTISSLDHVLCLRRSASLPESTEDIEKTRRCISHCQRILVCQTICNKLANVETSGTPELFQTYLIEALEYLKAHAKMLKASEGPPIIDHRASEYFANALRSLRALIKNMHTGEIILIDTAPSLKKKYIEEIDLDSLAEELGQMITHMRKPSFLKEAQAKLEIRCLENFDKTLYRLLEARSSDLETKQDLTCCLLENLAQFSSLIACRATPHRIHPLKVDMFSVLLSSVQSSLSRLSFNGQSVLDFIIDPHNILSHSDNSDAESFNSSYAVSENSLAVSSVSSDPDEEGSNIISPSSSVCATYGFDEEDEFSDESWKIQFIMQNLPLLSEAVRILRENVDFVQNDTEACSYTSSSSGGTRHSSDSDYSYE